MTCCNEGELLAYLEGETAPELRTVVSAHLEGCPSCQSSLARLEREKEAVSLALEPYMQAFQAASRGRPSALPPLPDKLKGVPLMKRNIRGFAAAAAVAVLAGGLVFFPPARTMAGQFLSVFRVNRVQVVQLNEQDLQEMARALQANAPADIESFGRVEAVSAGENRSLTATQARQEYGAAFPDSLDGLPLRGQVELQPGQRITITPRVAEINRYLQALGSTALLPEELDGKAFTVTVPSVLLARYGGAEREIGLARAGAPTVQVPEGVDVTALRGALLGIPALPPSLRQALGQVNDWQRTLLVPDVGGAARQVSVNGASGVFISQPVEAGAREGAVPSGLLWPQGDQWLALSGSFTLPEALRLAETLR